MDSQSLITGALSQAGQPTVLTPEENTLELLRITPEKLLPQRIFAVEQTLTRKYNIEQTLYFEVGADGLPVQPPSEASPPLISVPLKGDLDMRGRTPKPPIFES